MAKMRPGWYPDPAGMPCGRWWDGYRWTDYTIAPVQMQMLAAQHRTSANMNILTNLAIIAAVIGAMLLIGYALRH